MERKKPILFFDCGDTIIDEATELKREGEISYDAELIPGGDALIRTLAERGYTLALVADGPAATFTNLLGKYDLYKYFSAYAISEEVGVHKPDKRMFEKAAADLGIPREEYGDVWMVGNNLARDIRGAKLLGMKTVWLDWSSRRSKIPADQWEVPDYTIKLPLELLTILGEA